MSACGSLWAKCWPEASSFPERHYRDSSGAALPPHEIAFSSRDPKFVLAAAKEKKEVGVVSADVKFEDVFRFVF